MEKSQILNFSMTEMVTEISSTITKTKVNFLVILMNSFWLKASSVRETSGVWSLWLDLCLHYFLAVCCWVSHFTRYHFLTSKIWVIILISKLCEEYMEVQIHVYKAKLHMNNA